MRAGRASSLIASALGLLAALPALIALRRFTVDDAWIPARYAANLAAGLGYRFNAGDPPTDGVTPLPWAPLLALLGGSTGIQGAWWAGRAIGVIAWLASAALLARSIASIEGRATRHAALVPIALSAPLAAWSVAGLETGLTVLLVTIAITATRPLVSALAVGLAATLRPELIVLAATFSLALAVRDPVRVRPPLLAILPWLIVVALRLLFFGRPVPLSVLAKPSDLTHGSTYVIAGLLLAGAPVLALAWPVGWSDRAAHRRWIALLAAALAHAAAVAWAGGDWMPLARLLVPSMPLWILAAALALARSSPLACVARLVLAVAALLVPWWRVGASAASVVPIRDALITQARPLLPSRTVIAALDAGWVSAAAPSTPVVDLAGLTVPAFAVLPGGHTSKAITGAMLARRQVDTLVFLRREGCEGDCVRPDGGPFARQVEERLAHDTWIREQFRPAHELRSGSLVYVVLTRQLP